MPIQQLMLGSTPGPATKYIDEVFNIYAWTGTGSSNTITNGVNLSGKGGMVRVKNRDANDNHWLISSAMGIGNGMRTNSNADKFGLGNAGVSSFNSNGFTVGTKDSLNGDGEDIISWAFRNSKAFQTLTYEGTGSTAQNISHSLGSIPGMIIVKNIDSSGTNWIVKHRSLPDANQYIMFNSTNASATDSNVWNNTNPTATQFTVGNSDETNTDGDTHVAYIFAGGESTAATATSVDMDTDGYLTVPSSSDFAFGTGAYTIECWIYYVSSTNYTTMFEGRPDSTNGAYLSLPITDGELGLYKSVTASNDWYITPSSATALPKRQWTHVAVVREGTGSNETKMYFNGKQVAQGTDNEDYDQNAAIGIGAKHAWNSGDFVGKFSNYRVVKGTAVYTTNFVPSTEPLTNITNTKLLCCQGSSTTAATVIPTGSITATNSPTADTQSPFDDPAAYVFGEEGDQNIFKMGSYVGNGSATGPEVYVGWEPQYVLIKRIDDSEMWMLFDSMRGIRDGQTDKELYAQSSSLEYNYDRLELTSTGFRPMVDNNYTNNSSGTYVYFCVRRADGDVGKPVETGSAVFSMNSGSASGAPLFDSTHVVDYQFVRNINSTWNWETGARLIGSHQVYLNTNGAETEIDDSGWRYDYMNGWHTNTGGISNYMCWMFKRHAGMDVVVYTGNGNSGRQIPHSLGTNSPEMIWVKNRTSTDNWQVWHKDLTSGNHLVLNSGDAETTSNSPGLGTVSTKTFNVGSFGAVNGNGEEFVAMLFSSVSGVSKLGIYTGNGSSSGPTVTLGFQPRMVIIRRIDAGDAWFIFDTARGVNNSGNDAILKLNSTASETTNTHRLAFNSDDFTLTSDDGGVNASSGKYIYYAHA